MGQIFAVHGLVDPQHILQRCRRQHILLLDAQALAFPSGIIGIQNTGNVLRLVLLCQCPQIVLIVEGIEIQFFFCLALPQTQGIDILCTIANNRYIVGHCQNRMIGEFYLNCVVIATVGPGVAVLGPVISRLHLAASLVKLLLEQAETVTKTVAGQRDIGAGSAIQEAGSQSAQTAVTQRCIFNVLQNGKIHATLREQLLHFIQNAQIVQVGVYQTANQVFCRNIVSLALMLTGMLGAVPLLRNSHHHSLTQCLVQFLRGSFLQRHVIRVLQLCFRPL